MHYQFSKDFTSQQTDHLKPSGARKKTGYDFRNFKFSYDSSKDSTLDDATSFVSQRNLTKQPAEQFRNGEVHGRTTQFQQRNIARDDYRDSEEPFHEIRQTLQRRQLPGMLNRSQQPEKQLFYQQKIRQSDPRIVLEMQECSNEDCSNTAESEKEECGEPAEQEKEEQEASEVPVYQPFTETFRDMTIHDLINQCENHVSVINTCDVLQKVIADEIMKQVKLDDLVCQKLTARAQRLQQQSVFLEKVQAPNWMTAALDDLSTRSAQRAQAYKTQAVNLLKECQAVQSSIDETPELVKAAAAAAAAADRSQETKDDDDTRNETSLNSMQTSKTPEETEEKLGCKSFLQINESFQAIRKPWMKLLSLLEYQQEQYDATITQMEQVEVEIEKFSSNEEVDSSPWRAQLKKKDLETKKELLEARREHLETDVNHAKKDISEFELNNRDSILDVLNALLQHKSRCDSLLRESFQLLLAASLRDPTCFIQHANKHDHGANDREASNNRPTTSVTGKSQDSRMHTNSPQDQQKAQQMCRNASCGKDTTSASVKNHEFTQTRNNAASEAPNSADFLLKPPPREFRGSNRFQNQKHPHSYMLFSDSESGMGSKTNVGDAPSVDAKTVRYVNTKQGYGTDGYKSSISDLNFSRADEYKSSRSDVNFTQAIKTSPVSVAGDGICEERNEQASSPDGNDDSKTTSWSVSSSQAEQNCHTQFKSSASTADVPEKTSQKPKEGHDKHPLATQASVYQDICGREYNNHRFHAGIPAQSISVDIHEKDSPGGQRYYRTGIITPDVLSNKEFREAYFINKYAGNRQSDRSFLMTNMHGMTSLAWRYAKGFSTKRPGRGCHGNGSRRSRDSLAKRGGNKRKSDSTIVKESAAGLENVDGSCQDVYSDSSLAGDDNTDLQRTAPEQPK